MIVQVIKNRIETDARVVTYCEALENRCKVKVFEGRFKKVDRLGPFALASVLANYIYFFLKLFIYFITHPSIRIIHINNTPNFLIFAGILNRFIYGTKLILDHHDIMPVLIKEKSGNRVFHALAYMEHFLSTKTADYVLCADYNQKKYLKKSGAGRKKVEVIINVANNSIFIPTEAERDDNEFRLIYHGTISYRLGIDLLIKAVDLCRLSIPNIKLYLIGQGAYTQSIDRMISEYDLRECIYFPMESIPLDQLPELISKMDAGVIGNRETELSRFMLPVKLIEYVNMKIPVVAPRLDNFSYYFSEDSLLYYTPEDTEDMAEKITELCQNRDLRKRLVDNSQRFVSCYNKNTEMEKYLNVIESLVEKKEKRSKG